MVGWGDESGYHVDLVGATSSRELALIDPGGVDAPSWTGFQCLSGDGTQVAVVVLPASSVDLAVARDRGAFAYAVEVSTGVVRPVISGVALTYFSPGCDSGHRAAFTQFGGTDQASTSVAVADLSTGSVAWSVKVDGQLTGAVPSGDGLVGARGSQVQRVAPDGAASVVASTSGQPFDLRDDGSGGVSYLVASADRATGEAFHATVSGVEKLGSGDLSGLALYGGSGGRSTLVGATSTDGSALSHAGVVAPSKVDPGGAVASARGSFVVSDPGQDGVVSAQDGESGEVQQLQADPTSKPATTAISPRGPPAGGSAGGAVFAPASWRTSGARAASTATTLSPVCAVPRLSATAQVMQPSPAQIDWAAQLAERGLLTGAAYTRPANFANMGLAAYAPSTDFPAIALSHPSGSSATTVPRSVFDAIMAQESNFSQASWHAPRGTAGDPLVADYYGAAGGITSINYAGADCGYGVSQVTTGMRTGAGTYSAHGQLKIAVDYQENIAAGLQILEKTWDSLYADGIIANDGDPSHLENWFFAAWAYNSGIQPNGSYNTTGCTPGPSCTGPDGTWGLGWSNNPANPNYPPNRTPYLKSTYADAAHPANWSYEERVLGWMASPIQRYSSRAFSAPTYHGGNTWLQLPAATTFCTLAGNHCDPTATNPSNSVAGHCMLNDYECWWHTPVTWVASCSTTCATSAYEYSSGSSEPAQTGSNKAQCSLDGSKVPAGAIIVDDQPSPNPNLQGCSASNENWTSAGTFTYSYGTNGAGDPIGAIDTHQLGTGFGGRILFTHTQSGSDPSVVNTGTWTPTLPSLQYYKIKLHLPALGATATSVVYTINPGGSASPWKIRVNQDWHSDQWVTIGTFAMANGANVQLTNQSQVVDTGATNASSYDVAFDAIAFVPMGGTPGTPIGGPPNVIDAPKGSNPAYIACGCAQRTAGDPVSTQTGYYSDTFTDLSTPGRGLPLNLTRTYTAATADPTGPNGALAVNGAFGWGWTSTYELSESTSSSTGAVTIRQEDASSVTFTSSAGTYTPALARMDATLTKSGSTYVYTRRGATTFVFDVATGHLLSLQDQAGARASTPYKTALAYDGSGHLSTVTDPAGRTYTFTWTGSHVSKVVDSAGRTVTYGYDAAGDLTDVWGVGSTRTPNLLDDDHTTYTYAATTHMVTSVRTAKNQAAGASAVTAMTYDTSDRVLSQTDPVGRATTFTYGPSSSPNLVAGQTLVTDPSGHKTLDTYANGLLTSETKGYGTADAATTSYTYDPVTLGVTSVSDPLGHVSTYAYDDHGNKISASDPLGHTTSYAYDGAGHLLESVDPSGLATVNVYDQAGHVSTGSGTTNDGTVTYGDLTSTTVTLAQNVVESSTGNIGADPARTTNLFYDDPAHPGDLNRTTDAAGHTVTVTYDSAGDVASTKDALGRTGSTTWDTARGWLTSTASPSGGTTTFGRDAYGNVTSTTDPLNHVSSATYDADGERTSVTDANGATTTSTYDAAHQLVSTLQADGTSTSATYNGDGTVAASTDAAGASTTYGYDGQGRRTTVTDPGGHVTTTAYDLAGHVVSVTDALGVTTTSTIDAGGRLTGVTYSDGTTPSISSIGYDADGRTTAVSDSTGTSTMTYDPFGQLSTRKDGAGSVVSFAYDAVGNQVSLTYPDGTTITQGYDAANRLTSITDFAGKKTTFTYNADGAPATTVYPGAVTATTSYNAADQQTATTLTSGTSTIGALAYGRDADGQLTTRTPSGAMTGAPQTFTYTSLQQVKTDGSTSYGYDHAGNPTALGATSQAFTNTGALCWSSTTTVASPTCASKPTGATTYTSDADGRRTATTPATGTASSYGYDAAGRLTSTTVAGTATTYTYDYRGLRVARTTGATTTQSVWAGDNLLVDGTTKYIYGPSGLPLEQVTAGTATYLVHDQLGSTVLLLNATGTVTGAYAYTTWGAISSHTGTATTALLYGGGYTDTTTNLIYLRARYYDPTTGIFLTVDPALATTGQPYLYAGDNPANRIDPSGLTWWNPGTWTAYTWLNIGIAVALAATLVLTVGLDAPAVGAAEAALIAAEDAAVVGSGAAAGAATAEAAAGAEAEGAYLESGLFRGVPRDSPAYDEALKGNALPRSPEGPATATQHNLGNTADSPFTSWTSRCDVASRFAKGDGVILRIPQEAPPAGAPWSFEWSPDEWGEGEVLIRGPVRGAQVIHP